MPPAARIGDLTSHGGMVAGPGTPTVLIGGKPAAVMGDSHVCALPVPAHPPTTPFILGSVTVLIGGKPALRAGDPCICGAAVILGEPTVLING